MVLPLIMRYLLLSILVVCMIGVMVPSVFGQQDLFGFQKQEASPLIIPFLFLVCVFAIVLSWFAFRRSRKHVKQKSRKKKETSAFCENCGNTLNPGAKFCKKCGTART
jgi:uncharacterized membrane protein